MGARTRPECSLGTRWERASALEGQFQTDGELMVAWHGYMRKILHGRVLLAAGSTSSTSEASRAARPRDLRALAKAVCTDRRHLLFGHRFAVLVHMSTCSRVPYPQPSI